MLDLDQRSILFVFLDGDAIEKKDVVEPLVVGFGQPLPSFDPKFSPIAGHVIARLAAWAKRPSSIQSRCIATRIF
jgi:hypothetical protein